MNDVIRILIADDHALVKQGIKQLLEMEQEFKVIATASNGDEVIKLYNEYKPDVILMDINMPIKNGLQALEELKNIDRSIKIIILTIHHDREYLFKTLHLGADGYVLKDAEPNILIEAIKTVVNGNSFIQPNMLKELVNEFNHASSNPRLFHENSLLTAREIDVLKLISEGLLNKQIAKALFISEKTVKNHVSNIFRKINVTDRTQAAIFALKNNIAQE